MKTIVKRIQRKLDVSYKEALSLWCIGLHITGEIGLYLPSRTEQMVYEFVKRFNNVQHI